MTMASQTERPGAITMQGNPLTLVGQELKVGDRVPDFQVQTADKLQTVGWDDLSEGGTKAVLMILIPPLTPASVPWKPASSTARSRTFPPTRSRS